MSYFPSAREAARALGVPLLLRADPDPRAFRRHDRLGTLAVPAASAARLCARARDEASRMGEGGSGLPAVGTSGLGATWVTGPWGSLAHLPWAVGLADHLARERGRACLLEREPDGPLRTLAGRGRRVPIVSPLAASLLGGVVAAVSTDLEGVSILVPRSEAAVDAAGGIGAWDDVPVVLADGLPEVLEGPYPGAGHVTGVILVAPFRDHSRFELDAVVRRLHETGHRILGLVATGPEVSDLDEAVSLGTDPSEPVVAVSRESSERARLSSDPGGERGEGASGPPSPPDVSSEAAAPSPGGTVPAYPGEAPAPAGTAPIPSHALPPSDSAPPRPDSAPSLPSPAAIPLLSSWDRQAIGNTRRRRRISGAAVVLLALLAAAAFYVKVVRPLRGALSGSSAPAAESASSARGQVDMAGAGAPAVGDTAGSSADSSGTRPGSGGVADSTEITRDSGPPADSAGIPRTSGSPADSAGIPPDSGPPADPRGILRDSNGSADSVAATARAFPDTTGLPGSGSAVAPAWGSAARPASIPGASPGPRREADVRDSAAVHAGGADLATGGRFVIHFSSFKLQTEAETEVAALRLRGIEARSIRVEIPERGTWYRIVAGDFATFAEAESVVLRLQAEGKIPYAHIAADGGRGQPVPVGTLDRMRP